MFTTLFQGKLSVQWYGADGISASNLALYALSVGCAIAANPIKNKKINKWFFIEVFGFESLTSNGMEGLA